MKDMRSSEDSFLTILQNILRIMHPSQAQNCIFVNEDVSHYRAIIAALRASHGRLEEDYSALLQRYHMNAALPESSDVLLKRVVYRLLEIIFNSLSAANSKIPHLLQDYLRLKMGCQRVLQEGCGNKSYLLFKTITDYEFRKVGKYL